METDKRNPTRKEIRDLLGLKTSEIRKKIRDPNKKQKCPPEVSYLLSRGLNFREAVSSAR